MTRYAILSDLHGNEVALRAVLDHVARVGVDQVIVLGDVATLGPSPRAVVAIIRELGCRCVLGNHDAFLLEPRLIAEYTDVPAILESVVWCRQELHDEDLELLRSFKPLIELPLDEHRSMLACHGTPRSNTEDLLATTPSDIVDQMLTGCDVALTAAGHTHIPMLRQHRGMLLLNPGSVGLPFREPVTVGRSPKVFAYAEYAVVESKNGSLHIDFHRVELDRAALLDALSKTDLPLREMLMQEYS